MQVEANKQSGLKKAIEEELEWVRSNARGQQKKGKARLRSYEALTQQVSICLFNLLSLATHPSIPGGFQHPLLPRKAFILPLLSGACLTIHK